MTFKRKPEGVRRGPLSRDDKKYIESHRERHTVQQIAEALNRPLTIINTYIEKVEKGFSEENKTIGETLRGSPEWRRYEEEFTPKELEFFEHKYIQMIGQFSDQGVLPTENTQVCQAITLDILLHRVMAEQKQSLVAMENCKDMLAELYKKRDAAQNNPNKKNTLNKIAADIIIFEDRYNYHHDAVKNLAQRYETYLKKHQDILKDIKGTRDQRVKIFENSKQSFLGFLRALQDDRFRDQAGEEAALLLAATNKEEKRLGELHTYEDGSEDQPFKTPENVI